MKNLSYPVVACVISVLLGCTELKTDTESNSFQSSVITGALGEHLGNIALVELSSTEEHIHYMVIDVNNRRFKGKFLNKNAIFPIGASSTVGCLRGCSFSASEFWLKGEHAESLLLGIRYSLHYIVANNLINPREEILFSKFLNKYIF